VQYWNPADDSAVTGQLMSEAELPNLLGMVLELSSGRGHPAVELIRQGRSSLVIATDGPRCALAWCNTLKESFHSVRGNPGPALIFDYLGSWSEVPAEFTIAPHEARSCCSSPRCFMSWRTAEVPHRCSMLMNRGLLLARPAEPLPDSSFARTERIPGEMAQNASAPQGPHLRSWPALGSASQFAVNDDRRERSADLQRRRDERTEKATFARA
jgi:hypothetical protein